MQSGGSGGTPPEIFFGNFCVELSPEYPKNYNPQKKNYNPSPPTGFPDPPHGKKQPCPKGAISVPL